MVSVFGDSEQISNLLEINVFNLFFQCLGLIAIVFITGQWSNIFIGVVLPAYTLMIIVSIYSDKLFVKYFQLGRERVYSVNPKVLEYIENRTSILAYSEMNNYLKNLNIEFINRDRYFKTAYAVNALGTSIINGIKVMAFAAFFIMSIEKIMKNQLEVTAFIAMISYFSFVFSPINLFKDFHSNMQKFKLLIQKIGKSLNPVLRMEVPQNETLSIKNCSFSHDLTSDMMQLEHFTLNIDSKIGVVGVSGEGKSTLIKLLLGELTPDSGACTFGENATDTISKSIIYTSVRYYSQDIELFNEDLEYNITLGKKGVPRVEYNKLISQHKQTIDQLIPKLTECKRIRLTDSEKMILKELFLLKNKQLSDKDIISKIAGSIPKDNEWFSGFASQILIAKHYYIKEKYDEIVKDLSLNPIAGRKFGQRGEKISGGEKNRVAIAKFLLPEYGRFFVLDEPFTSLDAISEASCIKVLEKYLANMKGIIISHKMNLIAQIADTICVMENGSVSQQGTHENLIHTNGLYRKLWEQYQEGAS